MSFFLDMGEPMIYGQCQDVDTTRIVYRKASQVSLSLHGTAFPRPLPVGKGWGTPCFVIPVKNAEKLALALQAGVNGDFQAKPDWFMKHERDEYNKL